MQTYISIIIPTYNSSKTISTAIESILDQDYPNFEIIVLDGLSSDETKTIVENFADRRITFYSEKDSGVYDAMNKGISLAKGEWLYFLGGDDVLYDSTVLNDVYKFSVERLGLDVLYGDVMLKSSQVKYYGKSSLERLMLQGNICHQSIFYNRSVFNKVGKYNLRYRIYADWDLNVRCFMHPDLRVEYFDRIICLYNNVGGLSNNPDLDFLKLIPLYSNKKYSFLKNSIDYRVGHSLVQPLRLIKSFLNIDNAKPQHR